MRLTPSKRAGPPASKESALLTYCTNVHPGESWPEIRDRVLPEVVRVKERLQVQEPFGVGLRLSAAAVADLADPAARTSLRALLAEHGLYVFTLNGFPYGDFHGKPVKAAVYQPDWRTPERLAYTNALADLLAELLPPDVAYGSISTVPFGFGPDFRDPLAWSSAVEKLLCHVAHLHRLRRRSGRHIVLALEPEPWCALESIDDCLRVFAQELHSERAGARLAELLELSRQEADLALREHLGICLDACHAALEFEPAVRVLQRLREAAIPIFKVQLSAGLRVATDTPDQRAALAEFAEDVYLHQVVEQRDGRLSRYLDLPEALATSRSGVGSEWRIHFHVPIFADTLGSFASTQEFLRELCSAVSSHSECAHFEVETYTWGVLPVALRGHDMTENVANELRWILNDSGLVLRSTP